MMMPSTSAKLTIFEGPDGGGKSTAALRYAKETGARYVHFGPLSRVKGSLARIYVEAMMPALLGYQDVVFDRSWLSEVPYGTAFRGGDNRLTRASVRMLERLAMRCGGTVVYCLPKWETVKANYLSRKEIEYLENEDQLQQVYNLYLNQETDLLEIIYDYEISRRLIPSDLSFRSRQHPLDIQSAGNWDARTVIVGETFADQKDEDPLYQWPFASFSNQGCSQWLTTQLDLAGINEKELLWVNADQLSPSMLNDQRQQIIALGKTAERTLFDFSLKFEACEHPQSWKRFNSKDAYPLIDLLRKNETHELV